jgi:anti-anti-sigma regulatory factor
VHTVSLPGQFDITAVVAVAAELGAALDIGDLAIDASRVTRVDAAALQLLYAAVAATRTRGARLIWVGSSIALREAARTLALSAALDLPAVSGVC